MPLVMNAHLSEAWLVLLTFFNTSFNTLQNSHSSFQALFAIANVAFSIKEKKTDREAILPLLSQLNSAYIYVSECLDNKDDKVCQTICLFRLARQLDIIGIFFIGRHQCN